MQLLVGRDHQRHVGGGGHHRRGSAQCGCAAIRAIYPVCSCVLLSASQEGSWGASVERAHLTSSCESMAALLPWCQHTGLNSWLLCGRHGWTGGPPWRVCVHGFLNGLPNAATRGASTTILPLQGWPGWVACIAVCSCAARHIGLLWQVAGTMGLTCCFRPHACMHYVWALQLPALRWRMAGHEVAHVGPGHISSLRRGSIHVLQRLLVGSQWSRCA